MAIFFTPLGQKKFVNAIHVFVEVAILLAGFQD